MALTQGQQSYFTQDKEKEVIIYLVGLANSGKTTLFNRLTNSCYKIANFAGTTVEKKEALFHLNSGKAVKAIDLPGSYSLTGSSLDEQLTAREVLVTEGNKDKLILLLASIHNIEKGIAFALELKEEGIPFAFVVNMADEGDIELDLELLSAELGGAKVFLISAKKGLGVVDLKEWLNSCLGDDNKRRQYFNYFSLHKQGVTKEWQSKALLYNSMYFKGNGSLDKREKLIEDLSKEYINRLQQGVLIAKRTYTLKSKNKRYQDMLDKVLLHKVFGIGIFFCIMALMFQAVFVLAQYPALLIEEGVAKLSSLASLIPDSTFANFIQGGIISGVGSVLVFVPQIAILYLLIGILEQSGYLVRVAYLMDKAMMKVGLQGRSFIPLLNSFACAVPGIISTRTIDNVKDRLLTILIAPLMTCSARLPVYTILIAAVIPDIKLLGIFSLQGLVLMGLYLLGIIGAFSVAYVVNKFITRKSVKMFNMEMPPYRMPDFVYIFKEIGIRIKVFLKGAGSIILALSIVVWFLLSHPQGRPIQESYAGRIGRSIEPYIKPLGFDWKIGLGLMSSFAARESFISTMTVVYNVEDESEEQLIKVIQKKSRLGEFSLATAISLMLFYVFACQCLATLAICYRETQSIYWPILMFTYMFCLAYLFSFIGYNIVSIVSF